MRQAEIEFGFASFAGGKFELIAQNVKTGAEVLLEGQLRPDQSIEQIDKVLPTCVFVPASSSNHDELVQALTTALGQWAMYADMNEREDENVRLVDEKSPEGDMYRHCRRVLSRVGSVGDGS